MTTSQNLIKDVRDVSCAIVCEWGSWAEALRAPPSAEARLDATELAKLINDAFRPAAIGLGHHQDVPAAE